MFRRILLLEKTSYLAVNLRNSNTLTKASIYNVNDRSLSILNKHFKHTQKVNRPNQFKIEKKLNTEPLQASATATVANTSVKLDIKDVFGVAETNKAEPEASVEFNLDELDVKKAVGIINNLNKSNKANVTLDEKTEKLFNYLVDHASSLENLEFVSFMKFCLIFYPQNFEKLRDYFSKKVDSLEADQLAILLPDFRTSKVLKFQEFESYRAKLKQNLSKIKSFDAAFSVLIIFSNDKQIISEMNERILAMSDELTKENWLNLLNIKSIFRQRDRTMIEVCAYHLLNFKDEFKLSEIKKCFLSFGVLTYYDEQIFNRLLTDLEIKIKNPKGKLLNEETLNSILLSIGMLHLRNEKIIDELCLYLVQHKNDYSKQLIVSFIVSCANIYYKPKNIDELINSIDYTSFDLEDYNSLFKLLNYTWSLCVLKKPNLKFLETILNEKYWKILINDKNKKQFMPALLKLLQINLCVLTSFQNYNGPSLPAEVNVMEYQDLINVRPHNPVAETLSNFIPKDKCFKSNLLMPYGIFIDAFMITTKKGDIKPLEEFYNNETCEFDADPNKYYKIAFKYFDFKDLTNFTKKVNGHIRIQFDILKSLGYLVIPVSNEEFTEASSAFNKVKLIQGKIRNYTKNPKFVEKYF